MKNYLVWHLVWISSVFAIALSVLAASSSNQVTHIQTAGDGSRQLSLIFHFNQPIRQHRIFTLRGPERLVIDLKNAQIKQSLAMPRFSRGLVSKLRSARRNQDDLRVVLDLNQSVTAKSFLLPATGQAGHRLVVELTDRNYRPPLTQQSTPKAAPKATPRIVKPLNASGKRQIVIAIDAGHGGIDPGAIGKAGTYEKTVVLAIAKELERQVNQEPAMRAVMIRTGDYYLKLRQRIELARQHQADLFVSIHADAFINRAARGSSVYILSRKGASSEAAKWLAEKENSADLVGGVSLSDKDDVLASVLLDLSQTGTLEASSKVANSVLESLKHVGKTHYKSVQRAAFMVLRSPDIPSILIETAFLSNPTEEKKLQQKSYQRQIARAILNGIRNYFHRYPPPDSVLAQRR